MTTETKNRANGNLDENTCSFVWYCEENANEEDFNRLSEEEKHKEYVRFCLDAGYKYEGR